jgi:hypothetical protein
MDKKTTSLFAAGAVLLAVAVPTIVSGNARRTDGSLAGLQAAETPYIAQLKGSSEVGGGDPDGVGAAAVSFDFYSATDAEVCWDLSYGGIGTPTGAHIHRAAAGVNGPIVVDFGTVGATSASGCKVIDPALADEIIAAPAGFYVNVHDATYPGGAIRGQLAVGPAPAGSTHFLPTPLRAYDSRIAPATAISPGAARTISLATAKDLAGTTLIAVPPGATGAIVTLTITETTGPGGFLKIYSAASPEPPTSSINWAVPGLNAAVTTPVAVDSTGQIKVLAGTNSTHFVIDVIAYLY